MGLPDFAEKIRELEALVEKDIALYEQITSTDIPNSLKSAIDQKWELAFNVVEVGVLLGYSSDEQTKDSTRVIKLERALRLIEQFEVELGKQSKSGILGLLARQCAGFIKFLEAVVEAALDVREVLYTYGASLDWTSILTSPVRLLQLIVEAITAFSLLSVYYFGKSTFDAIHIDKWTTNVRNTMRARDSITQKIRTAAFPQSDGQRYRRRKLARHG